MAGRMLFHEKPCIMTTAQIQLIPKEKTFLRPHLEEIMKVRVPRMSDLIIKIHLHNSSIVIHSSFKIQDSTSLSTQASVNPQEIKK